MAMSSPLLTCGIGSLARNADRTPPQALRSKLWKARRESCSRFVRIAPSEHLLPVCRTSGAAVEAVTDAEDEANKKRFEESGGGVGDADQWRWTLNWDDISPDIVVGSCPRSPADVDRLVEEAGVGAILCLQSELCHEALQIDWPEIRARAIERGIVITRVAVRDFDHNDQALMLPEAVRMLYLLKHALGKRVYVHCTAGINRATLTVVGYLTFVLGMALEEAEQLVKSKRSQAHPYIDCWRTVRGRLLEGRTEELMGLAKVVHAARLAEGSEGDGLADYYAAERLLIQPAMSFIQETFQRQLGCTISLLSSLREINETQLASMVCLTESEVKTVTSEVDAVRLQAEQEHAQHQQVLSELEVARREIAALREAQQAAEGCSTPPAEADRLSAAQAEIRALRATIQAVAQGAVAPTNPPAAAVL